MNKIKSSFSPVSIQLTTEHPNKSCPQASGAYIMQQFKSIINQER